MGQPWPLFNLVFFYFLSKVDKISSRLDLISDHQSRWRGRWPLHHHHSPLRHNIEAETIWGAQLYCQEKKQLETRPHCFWETMPHVSKLRRAQARWHSGSSSSSSGSSLPVWKMCIIEQGKKSWKFGKKWELWKNLAGIPALASVILSFI